MNALACYATLDQIRTRNNVVGTGDDPRLLSKLRIASRNLERATHREFQPTYATYSFDYCNSSQVNLGSRDLLAVTAVHSGVTVSGDTTALDISSIIAFDQGYLELDPSVDTFTYVGTKRNAITVTGYWGWHDDYSASGWHGSNLTVNATHNTTITTLTTTTNTAADAWGLTTSISAGSLIRVTTAGAVEYMQVLAVPSTTTFTVQRGANGATAIAHSAGSAIEIYAASGDVVEICTTWASLLVNFDDATLGHKYISEIGVEVPTGLPPHIKDAILRLRKDRVA